MVGRGMKKRGISDVVVTVLLILLVVAAVAIIWGFISTFLKSTDTVDTNTLNTALSIQPKSVMINWNGTLSFNAKMDLGESVSRVQITLYDSSGNTKVIYRNTSFQKLEVRNFYIDKDEHGLGDIAKITIAPVIETQTGLQVGTMQGEYNINQIDIKPGCGNSKIDSGEECDNGTLNVDNVLRINVTYNTNSSYCTWQCAVAKTVGPYCGDNIKDDSSNSINGNEQCDNGTSNLVTLPRESVNYDTNSSYCNKQCNIINVTGPYCGDGIVDNSSSSIGGSEQCDGINYGGQTCLSQGYSSGDLSCASSCRLNTTKCYVPTLGLVGYWKFDETSGTSFADSSGRGNTGSCSGSICPVYSSSGKKGGTRVFDGTNNYISLGSSSSLNLKEDLSFSFWIYPKAKANGYWVIYSRPNNLWALLNGGTLTLQQGGQPGWAATGQLGVVNMSQWTNVVITKNTADLVNVYINGIYNNAGTLDLYDSVNSVGYIGTWAGSASTTYVFNGSIDELAVWNRTLNSSDVARMYSAYNL